MDNLIDVLLETAFKEVNKSVDKHDKEIYDLKHELITLQAKADKQAEEIVQLKKDVQDYESMIIGLEAQKDTKKQ